jgi:hypothetical protein
MDNLVMKVGAHGTVIVTLTAIAGLTCPYAQAIVPTNQ